MAIGSNYSAAIAVPIFDLVQTIAEIAVALAGFSAVIGVVGSRVGQSEIRVDALRLQVMLESSLTVAAYALLPALIDQFNFATLDTWRLSSAAFLLSAIPLEFLYYRRTKNMRDMTLSKLNINTINWVLSITADILMLLNLFDVFNGQTSAIYLLGILLLLAVSGILFVQFAASVFVPSD